jgi:hypothetical protein
MSVSPHHNQSITYYGTRDRSRRLRGLRRRSSAAWLLGSRVRIPLRARMFFSCVYMLCCPLKVEASTTRWSLVQRRPTVCLCVIKKPLYRWGKGSSMGCSAIEKKIWTSKFLYCLGKCLHSYPDTNESTPIPWHSISIIIHLQSTSL